MTNDEILNKIDPDVKLSFDTTGHPETLDTETVVIENGVILVSCEALELRMIRLQAYVDGNDVRSDFKTASDMRAALDFERDRSAKLQASLDRANRYGQQADADLTRERWRSIVLSGVGSRVQETGGTMSDDVTTAATIASLLAEVERLTDYNQRLLAENVRLSKEAATARERAGVLEAEVRAWHAAEHLRKDEPHNEFMRLAEARARTRDTHAIDAAKFGA